MLAGQPLPLASAETWAAINKLLRIASAAAHMIVRDERLDFLSMVFLQISQRSPSRAPARYVSVIEA